MGQRASDTRVLHFDNVRVPAAQRLGAEGEGFKIAMATLDRTRPLIGALATGIARRALDESLAYAAQRKAFGFRRSGSSRRSSSCSPTWRRTSRRAAS